MSEINKRAVLEKTLDLSYNFLRNLDISSEFVIWRCKERSNVLKNRSTNTPGDPDTLRRKQELEMFFSYPPSGKNLLPGYKQRDELKVSNFQRNQGQSSFEVKVLLFWEHPLANAWAKQWYNGLPIPNHYSGSSPKLTPQHTLCLVS